MTYAVAEPVLVVEDIADLMDLALRHQDPDVLETLRRVVDRHDESQTSIRVSDAAQLLNVTVPTIRSWADKGVLDEAVNQTVRAVTAVSVSWVYAFLRREGEAKELGRRLRLIADSLEDRALLLRARDQAAQVTDDDLRSISAEELAELRGE